MSARALRHEGDVVALMLGGLLLALTPFFSSLRYGRVSAWEPPLVALSSPLVVIGLLGWYRRHAGTYSVVGRGGLVFLILGVLGLWPFSLVRSVTLSMGPGIQLWYLTYGAMGIVEVGTIGVSIDAWRTEAPSRWLGLWFPLAMPVAVLSAGVTGYFWMGDNPGAALFGLAWIAIAYLLWRRSDAVT